ncbi:MAG: hypothetical protein ABI409_01010 [Ramlibacter sp.]
MPQINGAGQVFCTCLAQINRAGQVFSPAGQKANCLECIDGTRAARRPVQNMKNQEQYR